MDKNLSWTDKVDLHTIFVVIYEMMWPNSGLIKNLAQDKIPPSPDIIKSVADLIRATNYSDNASALSTARLNAIAGIISSLTLPIIVIFSFVIFKTELRSLINRTTRVKFGPTDIVTAQEIQRKIDSSASEVLNSEKSEISASVSSNEIRRSSEVEILASGTDSEILQVQIEKISAEYDGIRANMPSGSARTRQMGAVMAKMRTLGRAIYQFRTELLNSPSPGRRLFAVASLQMLPDYNLITWLANTTKTESPYMQYQALMAILIAVRNAGPQNKPALVEAASIAKSALSETDRDKSRISLLSQIESEIDKIPNMKKV